MKIYFLGTCSGTEPMPDRKHSSTVFEIGGTLYWFDAGEGCSHTGYNMGLDPLNIKTVFISHPHIDHVGGLANLLWTGKKLNIRENRQHRHGGVNVYTPSKELFECVMSFLAIVDEGLEIDYDMVSHGVKDGHLFSDENISVTAFSNTHMHLGKDGKPVSFSYRIEAEGKSVVYSGDIGTFSDLDRVIADGCDALIIETGHFGVSSVCDYVNTKNVKKIYFTHSGREILEKPEESAEKIKLNLGGRGFICYDTMTVEL